MNKTNWKWHVSIGLVLGLILFLHYPNAQAKGSDGFNIAVSILPQKQLVKKILGPETNIMVLVEPGHSPVTYDPNPRQLAEFSKMDIYFYIGVPFERRWMDKLKSINKKLEAVDLRQGVAIRKMRSGLEDHQHSDHQHNHFEATNKNIVMDPHIWLSPAILIQIAKNIMHAVIRLDPDNRLAYEERFRAYESEMNILRDRIKSTLDKSSIKSFLVFHPSWGYFADEFGLKQIAIEIDGKSPPAKSMSRVIQYARSNNINVVFVQKQFSRRVAANIAEAIGGKVVELDPLAEDVPANLEILVATLAATK